MTDDSTVAAARGVAQCLRMLSDEAASLNLLQTFAALQNALATCQSEINAASDRSFELVPGNDALARLVFH